MSDMNEADRKRLGRAVIARRTELGMTTTKALAEKAQLSPRMVGDVENGRRDNFSPGAKAQIEHALDWMYGSIDDVYAGLEPTPVQHAPKSADVLASQYLHPSHRPQVNRFLEEHTDIAAVLERLLASGSVDEADRERLGAALDDMRIDRFPTLFEKLSRPGKLRVVDFGGRVQVEEFLEKEKVNALEDAPKSPAPTQGSQAQEAALTDDPQGWTFIRDPEDGYTGAAGTGPG